MADKSFWKIMMYGNSATYLLGKSGVFGKDAEEAATEYEEEVGLGIAVILMLAIIAGVIFGLLKLFGVL